MNIVLSLLLVGAVLAGAIYAFRPRPLFVLLILDRKILVKRGKVPPEFIRDCEDMMTTLPIPDSTLTGWERSGRVVLGFSAEIPKNRHQNFRNLWHLNNRR